MIALNQTAIDQALRELGDHAEEHGDALTRFLVEMQLADGQRRERWAQAFRAFIETHPVNEVYVSEVIACWSPPAENAVKRYRDGFANA